MPIRVPLRRKRGVYFSKMASKIPSDSASAASGTRLPQRTSRIVELPDDGDVDTAMEPSAQDEFFPPIPSLFTSLPELKDVLISETSEMQDATLEECLELLTSPAGDLNIHGVSTLTRQKHVKFLKASLKGPFPPGFVAADASRPWMLYWALTALYLLGEDVSSYRRQVIDTLAPFQNEEGGFGGGHGHFSHIATSYASVLSLLLVGGSEALDLVNRKTM